MKTLFGPFSQILTMSNLPPMGSISDEDLIIIYDGGVMIENETIIGVGKFHEIKKECNNINEIDNNTPDKITLGQNKLTCPP